MTTLRPAVMRRLMRELMQLRNEPPEGIRVVSPEENMLDITGIIEGPAGTPYEGGYFRIRFSFTEEFPNAPPKCWFATKIFHPNVSSSGEICVNTLKKDWKSTYGIAHILVTVKCLLIYPNPESALDEEAGKLLLEDYASYCDRAKIITSVHASPKIRPPEFDTPSTTQDDTASTSVASSSTADDAATPAPSSKMLKAIEVTTNLLETTTSLPPPQTTMTTKTVLVSCQKSIATSPAHLHQQQQPPPQPLQTSTANATGSTVVSSTSDELLKTSSTGTNGVMPLGNSNANSPPVVKTAKLGMKVGAATGTTTTGTTKPVKRPAGAMSAGEKRKKALKRL